MGEGGESGAGIERSAAHRKGAEAVMEMCRHRLAHMPALMFPGRDRQQDGRRAECDMESDIMCYHGTLT